MRYLVLVMLFMAGTASAAITEFDPAPPNATIPSNANRTTMCVGVDAAGNVYCNVIYTWKKYLNRFCCSYQRDLSFVADVFGNLSWLQPVTGKTDTRIYSVSNDGHIGGSSQGAKASLPVATLWTNRVPQAFPGPAIGLVSNYAYSSVDGVFTYSGTNIKPADCEGVYALNDVGGGLCWKTLNADPEHSGLARFETPITEDDPSLFISVFPPQSAAINNSGTAVATLRFGTIVSYLVSYPGQQTRVDYGVVMDVNDSNVYVGGSTGGTTGTGLIWVSDQPVSVPGTMLINAVNDSGVAACQIYRTNYIGCVIR